jgi:anti-sigma factor RsiW
MNEQALEKLLMDDALGALSPEASELLAEYVRANPGAESESKHWRAIANSARRALDAPQSASLPEFRLRQFRLVDTRRILGYGLATAAATAIGIGIGRFLPAERPVGSPMALVVPAGFARASESSGAGDFWSSQRLLASAASAHRSSGRPLLWTSPAKEPTLGAIQ